MAETDTAGPYVVWENNGCEGWSPKSCTTLKECLELQHYVSEWKITRLVEFTVTEVTLGRHLLPETDPAEVRKNYLKLKARERRAAEKAGLSVQEYRDRQKAVDITNTRD